VSRARSAGWALAGRLRPRVAGARADQTDEQFLEQLFVSKAGR